MGTSKTTKTNDVKKQDTPSVATNQEVKNPFKLTIVSKEELEKRRIPVYPYLI
jgi:hypothetical protein